MIGNTEHRLEEWEFETASLLQDKVIMAFKIKMFMFFILLL